MRALLVLAGLTGGSSEGYVMDLVQHANQQGFDCFVMIGRGLAGDPPTVLCYNMLWICYGQIE